MLLVAGPSGEAQASNPKRAAMGFRIVKDLSDRRKLCTSCHNPASPTYVPFDLLEFSRNIAHWQDEGDRSYHAEAVQLAAVRSKAVEEASRKAAMEAEQAAIAAARKQEAKRKRELAAKRDREEKERQAKAMAAAQKQAYMDEAAAAERSKAERKAAEMARAEAAEKAAAERLRPAERLVLSGGGSRVPARTCAPQTP